MGDLSRTSLYTQGFGRNSFSICLLRTDSRSGTIAEARNIAVLVLTGLILYWVEINNKKVNK